MLLEQMLSHKRVGTVWDTVALCHGVPCWEKVREMSVATKKVEVKGEDFGEPGKLQWPGSLI